MHITDLHSGRRKVELRLPANVAAVALRQGARLIPPGHNAAELTEALQREQPLDLLLVDESNGERIVITIR